MTPDQRNKLASALIEEAFICHNRGDHEDGKALLKQSVKVRFHDEIEKIIKGDFDGRITLQSFVELQHSKDKDKSLMARSLIEILMEDVRFLAVYKPIFSIQDEEEN